MDAQMQAPIHSSPMLQVNCPSCMMLASSLPFLPLNLPPLSHPINVFSFLLLLLVSPFHEQAKLTEWGFNTFIVPETSTNKHIGTFSLLHDNNVRRNYQNYYVEYHIKYIQKYITMPSVAVYLYCSVTSKIKEYFSDDIWLDSCSLFSSRYYAYFSKGF